MTEQTISVVREDEAQSGRWAVYLGEHVAEMTYRKVAPGVLAIDHTGVPREFRGQGIAEKLVKAAIDAARAEDFKIIPYCSYVVAQFQRHPEWADLRAQG